MSIQANYLISSLTHQTVPRSHTGRLAILQCLVPRRALQGIKAVEVSPAPEEGSPVPEAPDTSQVQVKLLEQSPASNSQPEKPTTLPVEVWRRILSFVVRYPGSLATDGADPFANTKNIHRHDEFNADDRIAILRMTTVCRTWHEVLSELLCEYLQIYYQIDLARIVERFEASKRAAKDTNGLGIGRWTRRVDLRMHRQDTDLPCAQTIMLIIRLFECTPNLEIYINSNGRNTQAPGRTHPKVIETLRSCCGTSLRRVEWNFCECPSWADLAELLVGTPNLETLSIITVYGQEIPLPQTTLVTLPHLKFLSLGMPINAPPYLPHTWDPLLACLSITPEQLPSIERLDVNPFPSDSFFLIHGPKLRILRTNHSDPIPYLPFALDLCPSLHSLIIPPNMDICIPESHPSIEQIGIFPVFEDITTVPERIYRALVMVPLEECLMLIEGMDLPKLKLVKIRNVGTLADLVDHPLVLQVWWRRFNIKGVRFEDKLGKSFEKMVSGTFSAALIEDCYTDFIFTR